MSAVSMTLIPASAAFASIRCASCSSVCFPKVPVPRIRRETVKPVEPNFVSCTRIPSARHERLPHDSNRWEALFPQARRRTSSPQVLTEKSNCSIPCDGRLLLVEGPEEVFFVQEGVAGRIVSDFGMTPRVRRDFLVQL